IIPKKIIFEDDPEIEAGIDKVLDEGLDGKKVKIIKITFFEKEEYAREIVSSETTPPKDKKILRGTKIVWKTLDSPDGQITYWKKMRVWATHYDQYCLGCNEWTAIGMRAGKGVIAVDPKVIPMRSKVYIPDYGMAVAGDTGGAIKGNIIDLGFDDARTSGWSARFVDIYLL
ncbi:MAG: 3D domain-containing protein, partial [Candidatus Daviesbacteria bacterium]|nr:3D domain-containing protein [Candidatus Daviesbacteria bacterium]